MSSMRVLQEYNTFNAAQQKFAIYTYLKLIDELQLTG